MSYSNYPNGFTNGVTIRGLPINVTNPGKVFWVNNSSVLADKGIGGSDQNPGSYQKPFSTIAGALDACTASRGDVLMVMPGHSETVSSDGGLALDVAGVAIVGLGSGSLRPSLTLDTAAAAAITVTAANVSLKNFRIIGGFADITNAIDVTAANFTIEACEFSESAADENFLDYIHCSSTTDNNADGLYVADCVGTAIDAGQNSFLNIKADIDRMVVKNNFYSSTHANTLAFILCATGKDVTNVQIVGNYVNVPGKTSGDIIIDNDTTANTGVVANNFAGHADTAGEVLIDADGVRQFENYGTAIDTGSGYLLPTVDS